MTAINALALVGLGLQTVAAVWLVKMELQKGRIVVKRQRLIEDLKYTIKDRESLINEVIAQTRTTNALLGRGAPKGTPDRYSLEEAVASYRQQIDDLVRKKEVLRDEPGPEEFPELRLLGAIILVIVGALLQIPLILK